ncbi:Uncharacterised protein g10387 [Pycnogonum litorale]
MKRNRTYDVLKTAICEQIKPERRETDKCVQTALSISSTLFKMCKMSGSCIKELLRVNVVKNILLFLNVDDRQFGNFRNVSKSKFLIHLVKSLIIWLRKIQEDRRCKRSRITECGVSKRIVFGQINSDDGDDERRKVFPLKAVDKKDDGKCRNTTRVSFDRSTEWFTRCTENDKCIIDDGDEMTDVRHFHLKTHGVDSPYFDEINSKDRNAESGKGFPLEVIENEDDGKFQNVAKLSLGCSVESKTDKFTRSTENAKCVIDDDEDMTDFRYGHVKTCGNDNPNEFDRISSDDENAESREVLPLMAIENGDEDNNEDTIKLNSGRSVEFETNQATRRIQNAKHFVDEDEEMTDVRHKSTLIQNVTDNAGAPIVCSEECKLKLVENAFVLLPMSSVSFLQDRFADFREPGSKDSKKNINSDSSLTETEKRGNGIHSSLDESTVKNKTTTYTAKGDDGEHNGVNEQPRVHIYPSSSTAPHEHFDVTQERRTSSKKTDASASNDYKRKFPVQSSLGKMQRPSLSLDNSPCTFKSPCAMEKVEKMIDSGCNNSNKSGSYEQFYTPKSSLSPKQSPKTPRQSFNASSNQFTPPTFDTPTYRDTEAETRSCHECNDKRPMLPTKFNSSKKLRNALILSQLHLIYAEEFLSDPSIREEMFSYFFNRINESIISENHKMSADDARDWIVTRKVFDYGISENDYNCCGESIVANQQDGSILIQDSRSALSTVIHNDVQYDWY